MYIKIATEYEYNTKTVYTGIVLTLRYVYMVSKSISKDFFFTEEDTFYQEYISSKRAYNLECGILHHQNRSDPLEVGILQA